VLTLDNRSYVDEDLAMTGNRPEIATGSRVPEISGEPDSLGGKIARFWRIAPVAVRAYVVFAICALIAVCVLLVTGPREIAIGLAVAYLLLDRFVLRPRLGIQRRPPPRP
jgi:hypothetical protein